MRSDRVAAAPRQCKLRTTAQSEDWRYSLAAMISLIADSPLAINVLIRCLVIGPRARHVRTSRHISDRSKEGDERKESVMPASTADNQMGTRRA